MIIFDLLYDLKDSLQNWNNMFFFEVVWFCIYSQTFIWSLQLLTMKTVVDIVVVFLLYVTTVLLSNIYQNQDLTNFQ